MTVLLEEFLSARERFSHHALLLANRSFSRDGLEPATFSAIAKAYCNLQLPPADSETFWTDAPRNPDLFVANRERNILRLEDLAAVRDLSLYPPTTGRRRLFFIDRCERMNANAANALLKVLEEPATHVLFLLTTRSFAEVLPTISSRCQKVAVVLGRSAPRAVLEEFEKEDRDFLRTLFAKLSSAHTAAALAGHGGISMWEAIPFPIRAEPLRDCLEKAESLAKKYDADLLRDAVVACLASATAQRPELTASARFFLKDIRDWKDAQPLNPSSQLWLARLFLRAVAAS